MSKKERILDVIITFAVVVCLMALMNSITKIQYGIPAAIVVLSFISFKVRQFMEWRK